MWGQGSGVGGQETFPYCLSLSSLGAQPSPAPKPVPLGNESGESPLLKCPSKVTEAKEGESRAFWARQGLWVRGLPTCSALCVRGRTLWEEFGRPGWSQVGDDEARCCLPVGQVRGLQGLVSAGEALHLCSENSMGYGPAVAGGPGVNVNKEQVEVGSRRGVSEPNG